MTTQLEARKILDSSANPAPLGLMGFGMTTILLNIHNIGLFELNSMILGMGIFSGGLAQIFAGLNESKKGNTFASTAFTSYGAFWLSFVMLQILPKLGLGEPASQVSMGFYLLIWGIFTGLLFTATLKLTKALQVVFGSLTLLFLLLAIKDFTGISIIGNIAGYVGIFCGLSAMYTAIAEILNDVYKVVILPLGYEK
ncbi:MAG: acetate uptake transporter [Spirochaetaceae bacterium]|nr:acetate uptake transporter [Spirochaetaceae bacterium]